VFGVPIVATPPLATNETQGTSGAVANSAYVYDIESVVYVQRTPIEVEVDPSRLFNSDQSEFERSSVPTSSRPRLLESSGSPGSSHRRADTWQLRRTLTRSSTSKSTRARRSFIRTSYGPRATLQVRRGDLDRVKGKYAEIHPHEVPDVAGRK
jgi:hypothetical protein